VTTNTKILIAWPCPRTGDVNFMTSVLETLRAAPRHDLLVEYFAYCGKPSMDFRGSAGPTRRIGA